MKVGSIAIELISWFMSGGVKASSADRLRIREESPGGLVLHSGIVQEMGVEGRGQGHWHVPRLCVCLRFVMHTSGGRLPN